MTLEALALLGSALSIIFLITILFFAGYAIGLIWNWLMYG